MPTSPDYIRIANAYESAIVDGRLKVGDKLPSIAEMTVKHGIGATTVKLILVRLEARRLVRRRQGRGTFVEPRERWLLPNDNDDDPPVVL